MHYSFAADGYTKKTNLTGKQKKKQIGVDEENAIVKPRDRNRS
jgi:hypothetical protein